MPKVKIFVFLQFIFFSAVPVLAQVDTAWVRRYNGPGYADDIANAVAVDDSGNMYVTGRSPGISGDYATIKYYANGDTAWVRRYNGPANGFDVATAVAVDDSGNVYVTGTSSATGTYYDYATLKYKPNGNTAWVKRYNGPGYGDDIANAVAVDDSGNVYVTGQSVGSGTFSDYATLKYSPNGDSTWVRRYNGPANGFDNATALAVDDSANVYVTGLSQGDYATLKYSPNGDTVWVRRYNGPANGLDNAKAVAVDDSGNVYVTGGSEGSGTFSDYATLKYSPNGDTGWVRRYNGPGNSSDNAYALAVDDSGNVCVTGVSVGSGTLGDYATLKYSPNGDTAWVRRYNGPGNGFDNATALAVDDSANVYVTGKSSGTSDDYATLKYSPNGNTAWVRRYNGPGNGFDAASAIAVDDSGNVCVTGVSVGSGTLGDYVTITYVQFACVDTAGDANGDGSVTLPDIIYLVNRVFKGGSPTSPVCRGDANADGVVTLPDIIYLVNRVFKGGPAPLKSKECCL